MIDKLRYCFDDMVVFKNLQKNSFFNSLSLPSFMRDWLLKRFCAADGHYDEDELSAFVQEHIPRKDAWATVENRIVYIQEPVKILARIICEIDIGTREVSFSLPDYGLKSVETCIDHHVWESHMDDLIKGYETWGMLELGYREAVHNDKGKITEKGKIKLRNFKNFCPYSIDLDFYKSARNEFTTEEWIDLLLGAVDYNAAGYQNEEEKLTLLTRLLPFLEKRLNLIELAPKGTGKSYLYGRVSKYGTIQTGAKISRTKMFYDRRSDTEGFLFGKDFVVLDEIQNTGFTDKDDMRQILRAYLESGLIEIDSFKGSAHAGVILSGNISKRRMDLDGADNMFAELPAAFHDSAMIDRFHGFIKGWNIPRMNDDLKISNWALNSEYFSTILHELQNDTSYRVIVDKLINVPSAADTRDTEAIKRITTAYLKLIFPNVRKTDDISAEDFDTYCLSRAIAMRSIIIRQLGLLDSEFQGKTAPNLTIKTQLCKS
jgi:ATP-dependent Lon protease